MNPHSSSLTPYSKSKYPSTPEVKNYKHPKQYESRFILQRFATRYYTQKIFSAKRVICFDLETTGLGPDARICEIGAVEIIDGKRTGRCFQMYCNPEIDVGYSEKIHHLSNAFLKTQPSTFFALTSFLKFTTGKSILVAHNSNYDCRILEYEINRLNIPFQYPKKNGKKKPVFCTLRYFRSQYPNTSAKLENVIKYFHLQPHGPLSTKKNLHSALTDSEWLSAVFIYFRNFFLACSTPLPSSEDNEMIDDENNEMIDGEENEIIEAPLPSSEDNEINKGEENESIEDDENQNQIEKDFNDPHFIQIVQELSLS